ncbi:MAG: hypothetical protein A2Y33_13145 [Spirochaetes bacterium GWF1_51_8]|nr:MAG: hypothetical protein A2Y33_13145 [Spirochaetes bacterium GWF1_51_8]
MVNRKTAVTVLSAVGMALLLTASLVSILSEDGGKPFAVTALRGTEVTLYGGEGIYNQDSVTKAILFRGFDWANLGVCLPLFVLGLIFYLRGSFWGTLLLASVFTYLAYNYLIGVMGNAYNVLFPVWTALFAIGIFGLASVVGELNLSGIQERFGPKFPVKSLSIYVLFLGLFLLAQYGVEIVKSYISSQPPIALEHYTTYELAAFELGLMVPLHLIGGIQLLRKKAAGYLISALLAFTAAMTFISLFLGGLILYYFNNQKTDLIDVIVPSVLALAASSFSIVIFAKSARGKGNIPA